MVKPTNSNSDYREEERLACVLVLDTFNAFINEIVGHAALPFCLWPVDGRPLLDYTIHMLIRSGLQEIILLTTTHSHEIRSYITNSQWLRAYPKLIRLIPCKDARSLGDCLKDLEQENIVNHHFLLLYGNGLLISNEKLNALFDIHKQNIKNDKNCIMTLVHRQLDSNHFEHPSYTEDQHLLIIRDCNTNRLYDYSIDYIDKYEIPLDVLEKTNVTIETLYCPLDCHLAVCSPDVLHLFKDNFDYSTVNDFVRGVLRDEEIAGHTIYSYLYEKGYFQSVHNLRLYIKATLDILRRWSYPLVPEIISSMTKQQFTNALTPATAQVKPMDSYLTYYNTYYPIIYDKHNIYKQGDVQLDRLSHIQQDVFIGNKSQIQSGVVLRSSIVGQNCIIGKNTHIENSIIWNSVQIGENCVIKNSIICDNVLIRNNVQIAKECVLCKNVVIGANVQIKHRVTIVASNSIVASTFTDDVEIDDDMQTPSKHTKRSGSKRRSSSTRISEKSAGSTAEEMITSDNDLVGADGLGKELVFNPVHDDQPRQSGHDDDDDDDELNNLDDNKNNAYDAWGYRLGIGDGKVSSEKDNEDFSDRQRIGESNPRKLSDSTSDDSSSESTSDDGGDDNAPTTEVTTGGGDSASGSAASNDSSSEQSSSEESVDDSEFQQEVIHTLKRAYKQKLNIENIIVELNMLKPTYSVSPTEFDSAIIHAVFLLPIQKKLINNDKASYWQTLKSTLDQTTKFILKHYLKNTNEQAQFLLLNELDSICLKRIQPIGERIANILHSLYESDVIDEQWILKWYEKKQEKMQKNQIIVKSEEQVYYDKLKEFIDWLKNAESDDDDDND